MTRTDKIKAQIEAGGEGCVPYGSLSELLGLVIAQNEALKKSYDDLRMHDMPSMQTVNAALAQFKAWNEVV